MYKSLIITTTSMQLVIDYAGDTGQGQLTRLIASHQHCQHHDFANIITITIIFITTKTNITNTLTILCTKQLISRRKNKYLCLFLVD